MKLFNFLSCKLSSGYSLLVDHVSYSRQVCAGSIQMTDIILYSL